jgi:type IV pilus assembly protein PilE
MTTDRRPRGYTLVELMLVVVVIAILGAIAIPAYQRYGYRARRVEAQEMLLRVRHAQERHHATYHRYAQAIGELGFATDTTPRGVYRLRIDASPGTVAAQGFIARAAPIAGQASDTCGELSIDHRNTRLPLASDASRQGNGACW